MFTCNAHIARSRLAVIDQNHHLGRQQARSKAGKTKFTKKFSKRTKTQNIVIVKEAKSYSYLPYLCANVCHNRQINMTKLPSPVPIRPEDPVRIAPNIATHPAPSTKELKKNYTYRF